MHLPHISTDVMYACNVFSDICSVACSLATLLVLVARTGGWQAAKQLAVTEVKKVEEKL